MPRNPSNFESDRHTLYAGWVIGELLRSGTDATPVRDDDGNYTNRLVLNHHGGSRITLIIPPPPSDWDLFPDTDAKEPTRAATTD